MTWINYQHFNESAPPGTFGGSICFCDECEKKRRKAIERETQVDDAWPELREEENK